MKIWMFFRRMGFIFMILAICFPLYPKEKQVTSQWALTPVIVDGSAEDWSDASFQFEKKVSVEYAFKNDGEHLFILFRFRDPRYLSTIKDTGMTIWFNLEGKKKKQYGISFTKKRVPAETFIAFIENQKGPLSEEEKSNIRANPFYFLHNVKVINKKEKSAPEPSSQEIQPAVFRQGVKDREIIYEFSIPLRRAAAKAPGVGVETGKMVRVGFEWGGLTAQMKAARAARSQSAAGRPMNPAVSPQSAMDRGTGATGFAGMRSPKKYSFWVDVQVARSQ